jgi:hypothetical protein
MLQVGSSKWARIRLRKASRLSRLFRLGNLDAAFRLSRRARAYASLAVGMPWQQRLELANAARKRNQEVRKAEKAKADALRPYMESTRTDL